VIIELIGVYDADGTWRGEFAYFVGARLGRAHCSLCETTHGNVREKAEWRLCKAGLPVPFRTFHRDDQPGEVRAAANDSVPVVVARTTRGLVVLLDNSGIEACGGSPDALVAAIAAAASERSLSFA
jgi:hypothetical protein